LTDRRISGRYEILPAQLEQNVVLVGALLLAFQAL